MLLGQRAGDLLRPQIRQPGLPAAAVEQGAGLEDDALGPALRTAGIDLIRLATPTTNTARLPAVLEGSSGFVYYVSVAGITGLQQAATASIESAVARLKAATDLPIAVGTLLASEQIVADAKALIEKLRNDAEVTINNKVQPTAQARPKTENR